MKMIKRNQNWRLGRDILVLMVIFWMTKEGNGQRTIRQLTDSIRVRLSKYNGRVPFAQPGMPCDEEEALRVGNFLYSTTRNFDLAKDENLMEVAKNICDFKSSPGSLMVEDIICLDFKCQCLHPTKDWYPNPKPTRYSGFGKCRNRYGESCVDEDDCAYNQICSDMKGPPKIVRLSEYRWQSKRKCKEDCIRTTCEAQNKENCLHPGFQASKCKGVTDCLQDPFQVVFHCIAKCHKCEGSDRNAVALELCQKECRTEVSNYARVAINRVCHLTCRSAPDPKGCVGTCEYRIHHLLQAKLVDACPFSVPYEKCVACVSDNVRFNPEVYAGQTDFCRKKCYLDGTTKDPTNCNLYCYAFCIVQKDRETFFECQAGCKETGKVDPLCARSCHNLVLNDTQAIKNECTDECGQAPSVCDLCIDTCRESRILEYQQGTVDSSIMPNCNEECAPVSLYTCTACQRYMEGYFGNCYSTCNSAKTASDCSSVCTFVCKRLQQTILEGACYRKCLQSPEPLCFFNCIIQRKHETDKSFCEKKCSNIESSWKGECKDSECVNVCFEDIQKLSSIYCSNPKPKSLSGSMNPMNPMNPSVNKSSNDSQLVCINQTPCKQCHEVALQNCLALECRLALDVQDSVRCHDRCLDVCDRTRRFFYENNHDGILSCETYCETGYGIGCTAGCESYCEATKTYRCHAGTCEDDPKNDTLIELPHFDPKDKCLSCRRRFRLRGRNECRKSFCAVPKEADESGGICLQQCIIQTFRQVELEIQSHSIAECNEDRVCEDKKIKVFLAENDIREMSFGLCLNAELNRGFIDFCKDKACDRICERAVEYESNLVCGIKDGECVEGESSRKGQVILPPDPCRNCNIRVAFEYTAVCRKSCALPPDLIVTPLIGSQTKRRNFICTASCLQVCYTDKFHTATEDCLKKYAPGGSLTLTEYLKDCTTSKEKRSIYDDCKTKECGRDNFIKMGLIHDCPKCAEFCHLDSYFNLVAGITCKDCTKSDHKPPDMCDLCKHTVIKVIHCSGPEGCVPESDKKCTDKCKDYCARVSCLQRVNKYTRFNEEETKDCIDKVLETKKNQIDTLLTAEGMACDAKCKTNCQSTCNNYCIQRYRLQGYCDMDCNPRLVGVKTEVNNIQPMFRQSRKDPRGPVRPTRRPGPGKYEQQWCCFSNGLGQCNAPRPGKESQHESQAARIDSIQHICKFFLISQLIPLALIP